MNENVSGKPHSALVIDGVTAGWMQLHFIVHILIAINVRKGVVIIKHLVFNYIFSLLLQVTHQTNWSFSLKLTDFPIYFEVRASYKLINLKSVENRTKMAIFTNNA